MNTGVEGVYKFRSDKAFRPAQELSSRWMAGDKSARKEVEAALHKAQLSIDDVTAKTLECKLDSFERLDRMLASAEARRNNALREIDQLTAIVRPSAPPCAKRSTKSRTSSSETSRRAK